MLRAEDGTDAAAQSSPEVRTPRARPSAAAHAAGAIVVGTTVALDPGGWYPFGPTKWFLVSVTVGVACCAALWEGHRVRLPRRVLLLWGSFLAWTMLAAALGRDPLYAWIGTPERRLGVLAWVLFAACCALGSTFAITSVVRWTRWATVAALWCGVYAVVEWASGPPVETASVTRRLGGPFGSAAYLGAALCLLVPIAAGVALDRDERARWRGAGAIAVVTSAVALVGSGSRAAWVGIAVAAIVAIAVLRPARRVWLGGLAVVCVALVAMAPRLGDVVDRSVPADSRLDEWSMAARAISHRPLLGAGPEGYRTVVADGVTAEYERTYGREVLPDRAHSAPLDIAATTGVPGMALYGALLVTVVLAAVRAIRGRDRRSALAFGVIAYAAQQLLLFPLAELDPVFWVAAGALLASADARPRTPRTGRGRSAAVAAAGVATVAMFGAGVLGVAADRAAGRAVSQRGDAALVSARRAVELRPDVVRYRLLVAAAARATGTLAGVDEAIAASERAVVLSPHDPIARQTLAGLLSQRARITGRADDTAAALAAWRDLVADDPLCFACQLGLGSAAAAAGDVTLATDGFGAAADLSRPGDTRAADALALVARADRGSGG